MEEIKEADMLIGIPSYNNVRTIGHVVRAVTAGLAKYFPGAKAVLFNSDGGSTDGTQEEVEKVRIEDFKTILTSHPVHPVHKIITPYHGVPGKGSAFRAIFEAAKALNAKACAVVDSDLRSITPEWMELLLRPIYEEGFDYVAPLYARHKFDGTITNSIVYPLTRALYGKSVRQPIGGDFGFSGELAKFYLTREVWETDVARFGIDIWMTTLAIAEGYKVCQSYLGAKIHDAKDPGSDLGAHRLESIERLSDEAFSFPQDLWVCIIYDFGIAYHKGSVHLEHLLKSMIPLYLGRVASFVKENRESSAREVEENIESLCRNFEEMKPYLIEHWEEGEKRR